MPYTPIYIPQPMPVIVHQRTPIVIVQKDSAGKIVYSTVEHSITMGDRVLMFVIGVVFITLFVMMYKLAFEEDDWELRILLLSMALLAILCASALFATVFFC